MVLVAEMPLVLAVLPFRAVFFRPRRFRVADDFAVRVGVGINDRAVNCDLLAEAGQFVRQLVGQRPQAVFHDVSVKREATDESVEGRPMGQVLSEPAQDPKFAVVFQAPNQGVGGRQVQQETA